MAASEERVVVLGGGYAGSPVAHALDKMFNVTLIDRSEVMYHCVAALRATADTSGGWVERILIPRNLQRGRFVRAVVASVDTAGKHVVLENGERIPYDYLVLATGSSTAWPTKPDAPELWTRAAIVEQFKQLHALIAAAKSIAVVGGGPTGTELAAELRYWNRDKQVTLFHTSANLGGDGFKPKFYAKVDEQLAELGVRVVKGAAAKVEGGTAAAKGGLFPQPTIGPCTVHAGSETVAADLVFFCIGVKLNNKVAVESLAAAVDGSGRLKVEPTLQVAGHANVFACGDMASKDPRKLAFVASAQALLVVKNIQKLAKGATKLDTKESGLPPPSKPVTILALSPEHGVAQLPVGSGLVLGRYVARLLKSKSLFYDRYFREVGVVPPAMPESSMWSSWGTTAVGLALVGAAVAGVYAYWVSVQT